MMEILYAGGAKKNKGQGGSSSGDVVEAENRTGTDVVVGQKVWLNKNARETSQLDTIVTRTGFLPMTNNTFWKPSNTTAYKALSRNSYQSFSIPNNPYSYGAGMILREKDGGISLTKDSTYTNPETFNVNFIKSDCTPIGEKYYYSDIYRDGQYLIHLEDDGTVKTIVSGYNAITNILGINMFALAVNNNVLYAFKRHGYFARHKIEDNNIVETSYGYFDSDAISGWSIQQAFITNDEKYVIITVSSNNYRTGKVYVFEYDETNNKYVPYNLPYLTNGEEAYARIFWDSRAQAFTYSKESDKTFLAFYQYKNGEWISKKYTLPVATYNYEPVAFTPDCQSFVYTYNFGTYLYTPSSEESGWSYYNYNNVLNNEQTLTGFLNNELKVKTILP